MVKNLQLQENLMEEQNGEGMLRKIVTCLDVSHDDEFFRLISKNIADLLHVDCAIITLISPDQCEQITSLAAYVHGQHMESLTYPLQGSPCDLTIADGNATYTSDLRQHFPNCKLLAELKANTYVGEALVDSDGAVLGTIAIFNTNPILDLDNARDALSIFARHVTSEIKSGFAREKLQRYKQIIANTSEFMALLDKEYIYREVNQGYLDAFGITKADIIGKSAEEVLGAKIFQKEFKPRLDKCLAGEREVSNRFWMDFPDGQRRLMDAYRTPFVNEKGDTEGVVVRMRDVTEKERAREEIQQQHALLNALVEATSDMIIIKDVNSRFLLINTAATKLFGKPKNEIIGRLETELQDDQELAKAIVDDDRKIMASGQIRIRDHMTRSVPIKGAWHIVEGPVRNTNGEVIGVFGIGRDITDMKQAEQALLESEGLFRVAFNSAPVGMVLGKPDGLITKVNKAFCDMLGYQEAELIGQDFRNLTHPDDVEITSELFKNLVDGSSDYHSLEKRYIHKDGQAIWVQTHSNRVVDEAGKSFFLMGHIIDITEQKLINDALKESEERYRLLVETMNQGLISIDINGRIRFVNDHLCEMFGYSSEELMGSIGEELVDEGDLSILYEQRRLRRAGQYAPYEICYRRKDGSRMHAIASPAPVWDQDGNFNGSFATITDITGRKRMEKELYQHRAQLEQQVKTRTAELTMAVEELKTFTHSISHDLKAPLRAMDGFAEWLTEDYADKLDDQGRDYLLQIQQLAARMEQMIDDLLQHARLGERFRQLQDVDMQEVVKQVQKDLDNDIKSTNTNIEIIGILPRVSGHKATLELVVRNLLNNAIKFVPAETRPHIRIHTLENKNEYQISVQDNGIGIEEEHKTMIFNIFERLHNDDEYPGSGVGLALVKKAVQLHSGRVWLESKPGEGSTFYFTIAKSRE
jgi:PAS domain S-box-containing protein